MLFAPVANDFGGPANRRRDHLVADDDDAQVLAGVEAFQQHAAVELARQFDGFLHLLDAAQIDGDALALLTVHWLDHHAAMLGEKRRIVGRAAGQLLCG